jgi:hypothetical protein
VLRARSCLIDGEAVACDERGLAVFDRLRTLASLLRYRRADGSVFLYARWSRPPARTARDPQSAPRSPPSIWNMRRKSRTSGSAERLIGLERVRAASPIPPNAPAALSALIGKTPLYPHSGVLFVRLRRPSTPPGVKRSLFLGTPPARFPVAYKKIASNP